MFEAPNQFTVSCSNTQSSQKTNPKKMSDSSVPIRYAQYFPKKNMSDSSLDWTRDHVPLLLALVQFLKKVPWSIVDACVRAVRVYSMGRRWGSHRENNGKVMGTM
jgi:hypothetical protein